MERRMDNVLVVTLLCFFLETCRGCNPGQTPPSLPTCKLEVLHGLTFTAAKLAETRYSEEKCISGQPIASAKCEQVRQGGYRFNSFTRRECIDKKNLRGLDYPMNFTTKPYVPQNVESWQILKENQTNLSLSNIIRFARDVDLKTGERKQFTGKGFMLQVEQVCSESFNNNETYTTTIKNGTNSVKVTIPAEAFRQAHDQGKDGNNTRTTTILFTDDSFFKADESVKWVITVHIGNGSKISNLTSPVIIETDVYGTNIEKYRCVFRKEEELSWSDEGCKVGKSQSGKITCESNHLSSFAIIVSPNPTPQPEELSLLSKVGCCITVISLFLTIALHLLNRNVRHRRPTHIQLNIYICLIIAHLAFVIGIERKDNKVFCFVITVVLHVFFLAGWFWMAIYAAKLYTVIVEGFVVEKRCFWLRALLFGYGLPFTIVGTNVAVVYAINNDDVINLVAGPTSHVTSSAYRSQYMCWIQGKSLHFGFLLLIAVVIVFNLLVTCLILRKVKSSKKVRRKGNPGLGRREVIMLCTLMAQLGLTWSVGFLLLTTTDPTLTLIFNWIFVVLNAFQGYFIFYFACIARNDMFQFWFQPIRRLSTRSKVKRCQNKQSVKVDIISKIEFFNRSGVVEDELKKSSVKCRSLKYQSQGRYMGE